MNIETILEGWLIPDERYPPFKTDDLVKLAFSIEETELKESDSTELYFRKLEGIALYEFNAKAVGIFDYSDTISTIAFDAGIFKFYIVSYETNDFKKGKFYTGRGTLLVDYFFWAENSKCHKYLPNLYYKFRINKIEKIVIPEEYKNKSEDIIVHKTKLSPEEEVKAPKIEVSSTKDEGDICGCYFAISLSNDGLSHIRIPNSYGRLSLGKEIRDIGKIGQLEINVQSGGDPPHFHVIKRDFYDIKIKISNMEILGYEWQINNAEISGVELVELKEWLLEKYNSSSLSNSGYIKFIWMCITKGDKDAAKLSYVDDPDFWEDF